MPNHDLSTTLIYSAAAAAVVASITITLSAASKIPPRLPRTIVPSPRTTLLPQLTEGQKASLGYPPDALPGARDVSTPYGSMRVYEWGPIDGRKVVMIHGDATPSPLFKPIAEQLVSRGCRILTFDLWGRGYSDTPAGHQHNSQLYMQQVLYAITSSPIQWTGSNRFSLVGFSMGSAISLDFFAHQPSLIESVVLLGPSGMLPDLPSSYKSFFYHHPSLTTKSHIRTLLGTLLGVDLNSSKEVVATDKPSGFTPAGAVQFQFDHHTGHLESFLSNIQYGPIQHQEAVWERAAGIITGKVKTDTPLCGGKILVVCGIDDPVVLAHNVKADLQKYLGEEEGKHWNFELVPGDHGFPWPEGVSVANHIAKFWDLS